MKLSQAASQTKIVIIKLLQYKPAEIPKQAAHQRPTQDEKSMSPWWPLLEQLSLCPNFQSSLCNSIEDQAPLWVPDL